MSEFPLMTNALAFTYRALGGGKMFQCLYCGHEMDGTMPFHEKPEICPACGCCDFEDADTAAKREAENERINKNDEILEDEKLI